MTAVLETSTGPEVPQPLTETEVAKHLADVAMGIGQQAEKVLANNPFAVSEELVPGSQLVRHDEVPVDVGVSDHLHLAERRSVLTKRHYPDTGEDSVIATSQLISDSHRPQWRRDTFPFVSNRINFLSGGEGGLSKVAFEQTSQRHAAGSRIATERQRVEVQDGRVMGSTDKFDVSGRLIESMPLHWQKAEEVARHIVGLLTGEISEQDRADEQHRYKREAKQTAA